MKPRIQIGTVLAVLLVLPTLGCDEPPTAPGPIIEQHIYQNQTINFAPLPNTAPAPVPSPSSGPGNTTITWLKVTAIEGAETGGRGSRTWSAGTSFRLTATPNGPDDPCGPGKVSGPCPFYGEQDVEWEAGPEVGQQGNLSAIVWDLGPGDDTRFNRDLKANKPGTFSIRARFRGAIISDTFVGTVVP